MLFCKISAYTREELLGQNHNILRHPDVPKSLYKELWETIQSGKVWSGEIKNKSKDAKTYWLSAIMYPNVDENGEIVSYSSIRHDITSQKAKEEFMANMSHELRTPLNSIIGFSGILNKKQTDESHKQLSKQIQTSSLSLLNLINDILDLSKIQNANFTIKPYEFNAYEKILELSSQIEGLLLQKTLNFNNNLSPSLNASFFGDCNRIRQIILNLISNAIKFTPQNGEVRSDVAYKDGYLIIKVSDNGVGMSKDVQEKIFKPFEQADGSTTRKYGGTGLGLSITHTLVTLMKGSIQVESQENVGTTFTVRIELEKLKEMSPKAEVEKSELLSKDDTLQGHVLVAEDNKTNQMLVKMLLNDFGLTCDIAKDGLEALELYSPQQHLLILMDENMPNMNGLKAMQKIHEKYPEECGPIIALTANTMAGDKEKFLELGMDAYVAKPINEEELYNTLVEFLPKRT